MACMMMDLTARRVMMMGWRGASTAVCFSKFPEFLFVPFRKSAGPYFPFSHFPSIFSDGRKMVKRAILEGDLCGNDGW
jgi:hypothetical protein